MKANLKHSIMERYQSASSFQKNLKSVGLISKPLSQPELIAISFLSEANSPEIDDSLVSTLTDAGIINEQLTPVVARIVDFHKTEIEHAPSLAQQFFRGDVLGEPSKSMFNSVDSVKAAMFQPVRIRVDYHGLKAIQVAENRMIGIDEEIVPLVESTGGFFINAVIVENQKVGIKMLTLDGKLFAKEIRLEEYSIDEILAAQ